MLSSSSSPSPNPSPSYATPNSSIKNSNLLPRLTNPQIPHINCKNSSHAVTITNCFSSSSMAAGAVLSSGIEGFEDEEVVQLVVVSFYKFADFPDHADLRKPLKELCKKLVNVELSLIEEFLSVNWNKTCLHFGYLSECAYCELLILLIDKKF